MTITVDSVHARPRPPAPSVRARPTEAMAELLGAAGDAIATFLAFAVGALVLFDVDTVIRAPLALVFVLIVPGWTLVRRFGARASLLSVITAIALSLASTMLLGQALVMYAGWHWYPATLLLAGTCAAAGLVTMRARGPEWAVLGDRLSNRSTVVTSAATVSLLTVIVGNVLVVQGVRRSSVSTADVLGLVDRLSVLYWLGVVVILAGLVHAWSHGSRWAWLGVAALIVALHGLPGMLEPNPRFSVSWVHTGFTRHIAEHGTLLTGLDARFSWAGFFSGSALLQRMAGTESVLWLVRFAPLFYNGCAVLLVALIARRLRATELQAGVAATLFCLLNWIAQDYFAPQATAFVLYLTIILLLLTVFPADPATMPRWMRVIFRPAHDHTVGLTDRRAVLVLVACCGMAIAAVISHQLTPGFLISATLLMVIGRLIRVWAFPVFVLLAFLAWLSFGASAYWLGHLDTLTGSVGQVSSIVGQNVSKRAQSPSTQRNIVVGSRIAIALAGWLAAGAVLLWQWWRRRTQIPLLAMFLAPFPMLALQPYGGEMALRVFLFTLPPVVILVAQLLVPRAFRVSHRRLVPLAIVLVALVPLFVLARFGNESFESFTDADVAINHELYTVAPAGSIVYVESSQAAIYSERVDEVRFRELHGTVADFTPGLVKQANKGGVFVLLTESQAAYKTVTAGHAAGWMTEFANAMLATGHYQLVRQVGGAVLLAVMPG